MLLIALTVLPFTWVRLEVWRWQHWVLFADFRLSGLGAPPAPRCLVLLLIFLGPTLAPGMVRFYY